MYKIDRAFMDGNPRYISTRIGFGEGLVQAGEKDNNVVALCADLTESIQMQDFKNKFGKTPTGSSRCTSTAPAARSPP